MWLPCCERIIMFFSFFLVYSNKCDVLKRDFDDVGLMRNMYEQYDMYFYVT